MSHILLLLLNSMCVILKDPRTNIKVRLGKTALTWFLHECVLSL